MKKSVKYFCSADRNYQGHLVKKNRTFFKKVGATSTIWFFKVRNNSSIIFSPQLIK